MILNRARRLAQVIERIAQAVNVLAHGHNQHAEAMERLAAKVGLEWSDEAHDWVWQVEPGKVDAGSDAGNDATVQD